MFLVVLSKITTTVVNFRSLYCSYTFECFNDSGMDDLSATKTRRRKEAYTNEMYVLVLPFSGVMRVLECCLSWLALFYDLTAKSNGSIGGLGAKCMRLLCICNSHWVMVIALLSQSLRLKLVVVIRSSWSREWCPALCEIHAVLHYSTNKRISSACHISAVGRRSPWLVHTIRKVLKIRLLSTASRSDISHTSL